MGDFSAIDCFLFSHGLRLEKNVVLDELISTNSGHILMHKIIPIYFSGADNH